MLFFEKETNFIFQTATASTNLEPEYVYNIFEVVHQ